ncbi:hypothetical protein Vadar_011729 [Vaccinium darrowii]|uniref:Uncharacterized protein n=1 Tax=Vaccinium darrowii TaxID=229202 RepID=A0ACB7ZB59_9ERIC|nr:hypothetical protein Vadar_011729 [Vaccinium darrowii]
MGKKAGTVKAKGHIGVGPSQGPTKTLGKRPAIEPNEGERRKKKKTEEDDERSEREKWVSKMEEREFLCERQLVQKGLYQHPAVDAIERQGLTFYLSPLGEYRKAMVRTFYSNMVVKLKERQITSRVGEKTVVVTPDSIAEYLNYRRPATTTYPKEWVMVHEKQLEILTDEPASYDEAKGKGRYIAGSLKSTYRTLNKFVHHNISPFSLEKTPTDKNGELLVVFGSETDIVDWARWIWGEMKDFKDFGGLSANIPFPIMVTALCETAGCKATTGDKLEKGRPGPITLGSLKKSESVSKPPRPEIIAASLPTATASQDRNEQWSKILHARQGIIIEKLESVETEQRRARRRDGKIMRLLKWIAKCEGKKSGDYYVETEEDKEKDTDEEGEGLHDFEEEDTEEEDYDDDYAKLDGSGGGLSLVSI